MSRLLMKRRNTIRIRNPPGYHISRALSTFRNTRSMAFYLRVRNRATETRARARSLVGIVIKRESSTKSRIRVPFRIIISERRRGKGEGLEKFNGKKSIRLLRALFRYENTLVNCRRKNKIASRFEARSSYRNV